jgi:uncharacterized protein YjbI with pentapeptide repeats
MRESGWSDAVDEIARHNNHVYVPDAHDGPLVHWVLQSGLTQEEAALIQPGYGPSCRPFADLNLDGVVDGSDAEVRDLSGWDFRGMDLTGAFDLMEFTWPCDYNLCGANLSGQNLANAALNYAALTGADLSGAVVTGAWFSTSLGFTKEQLYSTASYQAKDLRGIGFPASDLSGWDLSGQYLANAYFLDSTLANANLIGADTRGANFNNLESTFREALTSNMIFWDGSIRGLGIADSQRLVIRDYDGGFITVLDSATIAPEGHLQLVLDSDEWNSLISFEPGIPVELDGALELTFANDVDVATQVGRNVRLFNWTGVSPSGQFEIRSPHIWDVNNLYTTGEVRLIAVPEPSATSILFVGALLAACCRSSTMRLRH